MDEQVVKMIRSGESEVLEFKASFGKEVIETLCAFANCKGGTVLIGIDSSGKILGASCGAETRQEWVNVVKQNTSPSIIPDIKQVMMDGKTVIAMTIGEFPIKPVAYRDRYFKRVANSNHRLSLTQITNLHLQSLQLSWDSYEHENAQIGDLSSKKIGQFLKKVKDGKRFAAVGRWPAILEKLGYLKVGRPMCAER